jgi:serine protease Do
MKRLFGRLEDLMDRIRATPVRLLLSVALAVPLAGAGAPALAQNGGVDADIDFARRLSRVFQHVASEIEPSVVHIRTGVRRQYLQRDISGRRVVREGLVQSGLGSGVIVSTDGYIITNNHVIESADALAVRLSDGRDVEARLVGADPATDIAVLKVDADGLTAAPFGDSEALQVGEWVIAVGSPFGFDKSVTTGIVSAKGRSGLGGADTDRYEEFIQTDASINPGNSGGPLVNLEGEVVGINTAILASRVGGSIGIGFAIPSRMAETVYRTIASTGRVQRGWLGIMMEDTDGQRSRGGGGRGGGGILVADVVPNSPAERGGLRAGDIITAFNQTPVDNATRLRNAIHFTAPGSAATVSVLRDGEQSDLKVEILDAVEGRAVAAGGAYLRDLGASLAPLDHSLRAQLGLSGDRSGLVVLEMVEGSLARNSGLLPGDIVLVAGRVETQSVDDLQNALRRAGATVELTVERQGRRGRLTLRLAQ